MYYFINELNIFQFFFFFFIDLQFSCKSRVKCTQFIFNSDTACINKLYKLCLYKLVCIYLIL